jgi:hypothetical protein
MALEPSQVRKEAALRDAHQVPLLTDDALVQSDVGTRTVRCRHFLLRQLWSLEQVGGGIGGGAQGFQKRHQLLLLKFA